MTHPTQEQLRCDLDYNPETGLLIWKYRDQSRFTNERTANSWNARNAGQVAGTHSTKGYIQVRYVGGCHQAHVLIWIWMEGFIPLDRIIDHADGDGENNRWKNLSLVTHQGNARNTGLSTRNTSGVGGVTWYAPTSKWRASVKMSGKQNHLGYFADLEQAASIVKEFRRQNGFSERHGT